MSKSMVRLSLSKAELALLEDIRELGFGEIYEVAHLSQPEHQFCDATLKEKSLIRALRQTGKFTKIIVHDGEPTAGEYPDLTEHGLMCLRKIRF